VMTNPDIVFDTDARRRLIARSGWDQVEARAVLRDLGWEWEEELHALVSPDDMAEADAGVQAVEELHLHGYRTGYAVGPYGTMRLTLDRVDQVFTKTVEWQNPKQKHVAADTTVPQPSESVRRSSYSNMARSEAPLTADGPEAPAI
jgi:hypothetical protein